MATHRVVLVSLISVPIFLSGCCEFKSVVHPEASDPLIVKIKTPQNGHVLYPEFLDVRVGDEVHFQAEYTALLCVPATELFGGDRFVINQGETLKLRVRSVARESADPPFHDFEFRVHPYPDKSDCEPGGEEGKAKVGGGG